MRSDGFGKERLTGLYVVFVLFCGVQMCFRVEPDVLEIDSLPHFTYRELPIERDGQAALSGGTSADFCPLEKQPIAASQHSIGL